MLLPLHPLLAWSFYFRGLSFFRSLHSFGPSANPHHHSQLLGIARPSFSNELYSLHLLRFPRSALFCRSESPKAALARHHLSRGDFGCAALLCKTGSFRIHCMKDVLSSTLIRAFDKSSSARGPFQRPEAPPRHFARSVRRSHHLSWLASVQIGPESKCFSFAKGHL